MSNSSIDWKSRPTKFWWLIRLRMSKCHLKGTDIEDIRLRVESNPDLTSLCDSSRKLVPIHESITFKTNTNCNWPAFSPAKSCIFGFSLYCVVFSFALIDCCDYSGFGLMTTIETHSRYWSPRTMFCLNDCEYMKIMYVICVLRNES